MKDKLAQNIPLHDASQRQRTASDPLVSSWVNASAGSGKTKVLTDRMLRLLLPRESGEPGTRPEKILALTFTKAGANEMALRLSKRLSDWAVMDEADLIKDMETNLYDRVPTKDEILAARKLFAYVVDAPGGLKIMTIHSFCQSVLGRFPIEAGIPPHFKPLEDEDSRELMAQARRAVLARARTMPGSALSLSIDHVGQVMNEEQLSFFLSSLNSERNQFAELLAQNFGVDGLYAALCMRLGVTPNTNDDIALKIFTTDNSNEGGIRRAITCMAGSSSKTDPKSAITLQAYWDATPENRSGLFPAYRLIFLKNDGDLRKNIVTKSLCDQNPGIAEILAAEAERLLSFDQIRKSIACANLTRDSFVLGQAILTEYAALKNRSGALDFDDLILKTLGLLRQESPRSDGTPMPLSPWVMYKIDEGLDHILVDEAQDTNPEQWEIIQRLSTEFFTGLGAKDTTRTLFVVGDEKQSIFSFQRAAPDKFGDMLRWFEKRVHDSGQTFTSVPINTSFRSVQIILDAVDTVFQQPETMRSLTANYLNHLANRQGQSGLVELWPMLKSRTLSDDETDTANDGWDIPVTIIESQSGASQMAAKIGDTIQKWIDEKTLLESYARPISPGDILILVKSRGAFVSQLVRALKTRKIAVSGVDRMVLSEQLVVQDLCAAAAFALLPDDDLTLATLLKSPFIGYDEQRLYDLAQPRNTGENLWNTLKLNGDSVTISWLENLIERAGVDHPYEFFSQVVQEPCPAQSKSGLHAIKVRLGEDALDPLDEFLNLALEYEAAHTAGLQSFLQWQEAGKSEIKRQLEEGGGSVRIMTVHGSKGLQAPIVFLPDTVRLSASNKGDRILWPHKTGLDLPLVNPGKDNAPDLALSALQEIQRKEDEEYRRLLYVAMTRAEERLYIGGYTGKRGPSETSDTAYWYDDIRRAFESSALTERVPSGILDDGGNDIPILRLSTQRTAEPDKNKSKKETKASRDIVPLPAYFLKPAPEEPFPPQPLVPSRPSDPEPAAASPLSVADPFRFKRGNITHKLLQILPDVPPVQRRFSAEKFVARTGLALPTALQKSIVEETLAVLNDPVFAPIFGEGSMAEIPITGFLDGKTLISGQIDRIVVTAAEVLIVDFKTNRPPPQTPESVQPIYQRQMQAYARTLRKIYPDKTVRCALLWTDGPRLMEITVPE